MLRFYGIIQTKYTNLQSSSEFGSIFTNIITFNAYNTIDDETVYQRWKVIRIEIIKFVELDF